MEVKSVHSNGGKIAFLKEVIQKESCASVNYQGEWKHPGIFMRFVRWLVGYFEDIRIQEITNIFTQVLEKLDQDKKVTESYINQWEQQLLGRLQKRNSVTNQTSMLQLQRAKIALIFRSQANFPEKTNLDDAKWLIDQALNWKKSVYDKWHSTEEGLKENAFLVENEIFLSEFELKRMEEACCYPEFIALLRQSVDLQEAFFKWTIRNCQSPRIFIEFPGLHQRIHDCLMSSRVGQMGDISALKLEIENGKKDVKLCCESADEKETEQWISLLDDNNIIELKCNYKLTVGEVFYICSMKNGYWGDIEIIGGKLRNWHAGYLGRVDGSNYTIQKVLQNDSWTTIALVNGITVNELKAENPHVNHLYEGQNLRIPKQKMKKTYLIINLTDPEWYKQIPSVGQMSIEEAKKRYGPDADGKNWLVRCMATRVVAKLQMYGTHAYREIAIPSTDGRSYTIYTFAKSSLKFPHKWLKVGSSFQKIIKVFEYLFFVAKPHPATICSPDPNIFASDRQQGGPTFKLCQIEQQQGLMQEIKEDIELAKSGRMLYQILVDNCSGWSVSGKIIPQQVSESLYDVPFSDCQPENPAGAVFRSIRKLPENCQDKIYAALFWLFGARNIPNQSQILDERPWMSGKKVKVPAACKHYFGRTPGLVFHHGF